VGLISLGQLSVGLLFCVGQLAAGLGVSLLGQFAVGSFIWRCQLGLGLIKVGAGQLAVSIIAPFFGGECVPGCGNCGRRR